MASCHVTDGQNETEQKDLVGCLEDMIPSQENVASPDVEVIILDGAAITNMLAPGGAKTVSDYATQVFLPHITSQLQRIQSVRVDVVWDEYMPDSSKTDTRTKRGRGIRRRVEPSSSIPGKWQAFLRIDENNAELLSFLATRLAAQETEKQVISTLHMPESSQVLLHVHTNKHIPGCCSTCMMMWSRDTPRRRSAQLTRMS